MNAVSVCSLWLLCLSFSAVGLTTPITSAAECHPIVATVVSVQGRVEVRRVNVEQWQPVSLHDIFCAGDRIRVGNGGRADIALANRAVLRLDQNTTITLGGIQKEQTVLVVLIESVTDVFIRAIRAIEVKAQFVSAGAGETEGLIRIRDTRTDITILNGKGVVARDEGTFSLTGWESVFSAKGKALV
ncbi:FecR domain-containing protein [Candidatus Nitrospira allomarina]|uniref:FecR domain-containing protein n=1 Tax=Candidatus Nitrospira allomarina TaxID=3020900 RepID=A0AA96JZG2_9BACT|nr:FecR domain-containing protein [Candidatus Nitrospira allomarina]WNM58604.1 FecR domain-containing protein [Candidatus Nitrospira allomarina]